MSQSTSETAELPLSEVLLGPTPQPDYLAQAMHAPGGATASMPYVPQAGMVTLEQGDAAWPSPMLMPRQEEPSRLSRLLARRGAHRSVTWPMVMQTAIRWAGGIAIVGLLAWAGRK